MRSIGIHLSYWQTEWTWDVLPFIRRASDVGFDGAEFPILHPEAMDFATLKGELDANGLGATCGTGLSAATDITHPDLAVRQAGLAHLRACLEGAAALGSPVLGGVTYAPWSYFPTGDLRPYRQRCVESLREAGRMADNLGVTLCLEVLNRFEGYLLNTVQQGLELLAEVNNPHIKLHLDTFHLNIEEEDVASAIRAAGPQLGHFHCSENNRRRPGVGHILWTAVRRALDDIGYTGWIVMESFIRPEGKVGRTPSVWRPLADDLFAPVLVENAEARAALLRDPNIVATLERAAQCDVGLVGIGGTGPDMLLAQLEYCNDATVRGLRDKGAVGDILGHFFDINGQPVQCEVDERLIALSLNQLRVIPTMIAAAGGVEKTAAIVGALRGSYVNVLITDMESAQAVLARSQESAKKALGK